MRQSNTFFGHLHYIYRHWDASGEYDQIRVKTFCFFPVVFFNPKSLSLVFLIYHQFSPITSCYFHHCIWVKIVQFTDREITYTMNWICHHILQNFKQLTKCLKTERKIIVEKAKQWAFCQPNYRQVIIKYQVK